MWFQSYEDNKTEIELINNASQVYQMFLSSKLLFTDGILLQSYKKCFFDTLKLFYAPDRILKILLKQIKTRKKVDMNIIICKIEFKHIFW